MEVLDAGLVPAARGVALTLACVQTDERLEAARARGEGDGVEARRARGFAVGLGHEGEGVTCVSAVCAGELEYSLQDFWWECVHGGRKGGERVLVWQQREGCLKILEFVS